MTDIYSLFNKWLDLDLAPFRSYNACYSPSVVLRNIDREEYNRLFVCYLEDVLKITNEQYKQIMIRKFNDLVDNR